MDFWLNKYPRHIFFAFQYIYRVRLFRSKERIRNCRTFDFLLSSKLTTLDTFRSLSCDEIKGTDIFIIILETLCPEYSMNAKQERRVGLIVRSSWERARIDFMLTIYRRFSYLFFFLSFLACNISCETDHDRLTIVLSNQTVRFCFERNERLFVFIDKIKRKLLRMLAIICEKKKGHKRVVYNREPSKEEVGRSVNGEIVGQ